jgi:hypothetical protein
MSKNILLLAAIGGAVVLVMQKQAQAAGLTTAQKQQQGMLYTQQQQQSANVNGDMWARLLGDGWRNMVTAQNQDGSASFLKNMWGTVTTSDGKPVDAGDPIAAWMQANVGLPTSGTPDLLASISPFDSYIDGGSELLGW